MTLEKSLPVLQGIVAGKAWQYKDGPNWVDADQHSDPLALAFWQERAIRLKPDPVQPRMVPLGPDDVPSGTRVRIGGHPIGRYGPVLIDERGVHIYNGGNPCAFKLIGWDELRHYEILRPGASEWVKCEKEEKGGAA